MSSRRSAAGASEPAQANTRRQLIEAAREIFAQSGFRNATIRDISRRAGANIAAVNYHFGDKEGLYFAVMKDACRLAVEKYPPDFGLPAKPTARQRLHAFVRSFLLRVLSCGPHADHGKLMARELVDPSPALDEIVDQNLRPMVATLMAIMRELLGPTAANEQIRKCGISVVSQIVVYHHCRPLINRLFPDMQFNESAIEELAEHITSFSLAALQAIARKKS
jgi:TetR/AcrR family transcriptional regulator, regulator of cefoperazone and chloramphenicol sensitivity